MTEICSGRFNALDDKVAELGHEVYDLRASFAVGMEKMVFGLTRVDEKLSGLFPNGHRGRLREMEDEFQNGIKSVSDRLSTVEGSRNKLLVESNMRGRIMAKIGWVIGLVAAGAELWSKLHH